MDYETAKAVLDGIQRTVNDLDVMEDDAIDWYRAEVERLREERRWRSTKTEPPSDDQWQVLIYDGRNADIGSKLDGIGWTHEFGTLEWEAVTHWMSLPAPPSTTQ